MKNFLLRFVRLLFGLFLYTLGIVLTMRANIGYAPWDVFHVGLAKTSGMSIGTASILTGVVIGVAAILLGEKLGMGTILNMVLIGMFLDFLLALNLIPQAQNYYFGIPMMIFGLYTISLATYFYIGSGFGAGPRDSLMVALTRKTPLPVGFCRGSLELLAVILGAFMGGRFGIGTVLSAIAMGYCVQSTFKILRFDPTTVKHETLQMTYKQLLRKDEACL